jgi:uncharacterized membrane protein YhaH (DUF805 family)
MPSKSQRELGLQGDRVTDIVNNRVHRKIDGRSSQKEYWLSVALIYGLSIVFIGVFHLRGVGGFTFWILIYARRLHDIGKSLWWGVGATLLSTLAFVAGFLALGPNLRAATHGQTHNINGHAAVAFLGWIGCGLLMHLGFVLWLGLQKGDTGENRFGPPPSTKVGNLFRAGTAPPTPNLSVSSSLSVPSTASFGKKSPANVDRPAPSRALIEDVGLPSDTLVLLDRGFSLIFLVVTAVHLAALFAQPSQQPGRLLELTGATSFVTIVAGLNFLRTFHTDNRWLAWAAAAWAMGWIGISTAVFNYMSIMAILLAVLSVRAALTQPASRIGGR